MMSSSAPIHIHPRRLVVCFSHTGKGKALVWGGVPTEASKALPAGQWVSDALAVLGGKGGGKSTNAQGQGPKVPFCCIETVPLLLSTFWHSAANKRSNAQRNDCKFPLGFFC